MGSVSQEVTLGGIEGRRELRGSRKSKAPLSRNVHEKVGLPAEFLVDLQVENIRDLKIHAIEQYQIATDHDVRVVRRRGRKHYFKFPRAGLHFFLEPWWQSSANYELAL